MAETYSEALQGCPSSKSGCGDRAQHDRQSHQAGLHWSILSLSSTYQPLAPDSGFTLVPPCGLRVTETRKPTRLVVGRLHYSLNPTLSAHFRRGFSASERLTWLPSTEVLGSGADYRDAAVNRSIRHLPYPYKASSGGGSTPSWSRSIVA